MTPRIGLHWQAPTAALLIAKVGIDVDMTCLGIIFP